MRRRGPGGLWMSNSWRAWGCVESVLLRAWAAQVGKPAGGRVWQCAWGGDGGCESYNMAQSCSLTCAPYPKNRPPLGASFPDILFAVVFKFQDWNFVFLGLTLSELDCYYSVVETCLPVNEAWQIGAGCLNAGHCVLTVWCHHCDAS